MTAQPAHSDHSVHGARAAAADDDLHAWVGDFLASPGSDNAALAEQLAGTYRWWIGPVLLPLDRLHRLAGPPGQPVLVAIDDEDWWRDDVEDLREKVEDGWEPPPVVVTWKDGQLVVEDGNHRLEGMRRAGVLEAWSVVGFADPDERDAFVTAAEALEG